MTIDDFVTYLATSNKDIFHEMVSKNNNKIKIEDRASCLNTYLIDISKPFSNVIKSFLPCDIIY